MSPSHVIAPSIDQSHGVRRLISAVKQHKAKRAVGIEKAPERVQLAKENAEKAGVADQVEIRQGDVLKLRDFSEATVVTLQLLPDVNERLKPARPWFEFYGVKNAEDLALAR